MKVLHHKGREDILENLCLHSCCLPCWLSKCCKTVPGPYRLGGVLATDYLKEQLPSPYRHPKIMILKPSWLQVRHKQFYLRMLQALYFFIWDGCQKGLLGEEWGNDLWNNIVTSWHWNTNHSISYLQFMVFWLIQSERWYTSSSSQTLLSLQFFVVRLKGCHK